MNKVPVRAGFAGAQLPRVCDRERQEGEPACPLDSFQIQPEKCEYIDQQTTTKAGKHAGSVLARETPDTNRSQRLRSNVRTVLEQWG